LDGVWDFNRDKPIYGVKIVFATFVNDTDVPIFLRLRVWKNTVDFVQFERRLVAFVPNTDDKTAFWT
jgi:hypothetical protein